MSIFLGDQVLVKIQILDNQDIALLKVRHLAHL